jgi:uncharacterized membrane protein
MVLTSLSYVAISILKYSIQNKSNKESPQHLVVVLFLMTVFIFAVKGTSAGAASQVSFGAVFLESMIISIVWMLFICVMELYFFKIHP